MSTQNLGQLLFPLQPGTKKLVRQFEKCTFKIIKQKCSLIFNQTCINEHILPTYSNIYIYIYRVAQKKTYTHIFICLAKLLTLVTLVLCGDTWRIIGYDTAKFYDFSPISSNTIEF